MFFAGQVRAADAPASLSDWGLHCWCLTARHTPQRIVREDDNGRILRLLQSGMTRAELAAALPGLKDSQLALLEAFGLVVRSSDSYRTAFPVLAPETIKPVRARADEIASRMASSLRSDVDIVTASARAQGYPDSAYAMVFGYALDGAVWEALKERSSLPDTALDLEHPYWRGAFWAIYPERTGAPGRNEVPVGERLLIGVWTDHTVDGVNAMLASARVPGFPNDLQNVPQIVDRPGDPVHDAAHRVAVKLAKALLDSDDGKAMLALFPSALRQQAILAVAHELIWSVMEQLVRGGIVRSPAVLSAAIPRNEQIKSLMFTIITK
jgi:hypothetical protein